MDVSYGVPGPVACRPTTFEATVNDDSFDS